MSSDNSWTSPGARPGRPTPPPSTASASPGPSQSSNPTPEAPRQADPARQRGGVPPGPAPAGSDGWYAQPHYEAGWQGPASTTPPRRGPDPASIALWVIGALVTVTVVVAVVAGVRYVRETAPLGDVTRAQSVHVQRVVSGTCIKSLPPDGLLSSVHVVPCGTDHQAEVISTPSLIQTDWPGQDRVAADVESRCDLTRVQQDLGLAVSTWLPTEDGWNRGDRDGVCLVYHPTGSLVGSFTAGDEVEATSWSES